MKIALFGYGKMGKTIEKLALERGHEIALKINAEDLPSLKGIAVAIDFSIPSAALRNCMHCFEQGVPIVCGTTGWLNDYEKAVEQCEKNNSAFLYASNFSLGMNIFFELNRKLAGLMKGFPSYAVNIEEIHHLQKLDEPSGTAISLAEQMIEAGLKKDWILGEAEEEKIPIHSKRVEKVPGTHIVSYQSEVDTLKMEHQAHSREGFALGAIIAAEWLQDKTGIFGMKDVIS